MKLINLVDHVGRVLDIDSIKLVQGQWTNQLKKTEKNARYQRKQGKKWELKEVSYILNTLS
jgi:hypothetical protein